jgi:hypothetical protein
MKLGDIVTVKTSLGQIVGKTTDGRWIVEWVYDEIDPYTEEELFVVEEAKDGSKVQMP